MSEEHLPAIINQPAPAELRRELALAEGYAASALAPSTRRAYERDWLVFATWCAERGARAIPAAPASVAAFLASEADRGFRPVTIGRRAAAIAAAHRAQDRPNPCDSGAVAAVMSGIRRGPVFRQMRRGDKLTDRRLSDQSVALIVKRRAQAAGLPPTFLSGHSLRAGYATAAAAIQCGIEVRVPRTQPWPP